MWSRRLRCPHEGASGDCGPASTIIGMSAVSCGRIRRPHARAPRSREIGLSAQPSLPRSPALALISSSASTGSDTLLCRSSISTTASQPSRASLQTHPFEATAPRLALYSPRVTSTRVCCVIHAGGAGRRPCRGRGGQASAGGDVPSARRSRRGRASVRGDSSVTSRRRRHCHPTARQGARTAFSLAASRSSAACTPRASSSSSFARPSMVRTRYPAERFASSACLASSARRRSSSRACSRARGGRVGRRGQGRGHAAHSCRGSARSGCDVGSEGALPAGVACRLRPRPLVPTPAPARERTARSSSARRRRRSRVRHRCWIHRTARSSRARCACCCARCRARSASSACGVGGREERAGRWARLGVPRR